MSEEMESPGVVVLDAALDYRAAAPLRDAFLERRGGPVLVDAANVETIGGLCLQVLLAARQAWVSDHVGFTIAARSAAFDRGILGFGASAALGLDAMSE